MPSATPLLELIVAQGAWLLFVMATLETSFVWGFFIPTGVALTLLTAVALDEGRSLGTIAAAAILGGALGDSIGYWVGRIGQERWAGGGGRVALFVTEARARTAQWFGGRTFLSVTVARVVSFVRTVMPLAAGMSGVRYGRFLGYEIPGVLLWCALYMAAGVAAEEGWVWAVRMLGPVGAGVFLAAAVGAALVARWWMNHPRARRPS